MNKKYFLIAIALLMLFVSMVVLPLPAEAQASLTSTCQTCTVGQTVTYTGTGFHKSKGNDVPFMRVWVDDVDATTCMVTSGTNFSCSVTYTVAPGVYNIVVYDKSDLNAHGITVLGATNCILQAPAASTTVNKATLASTVPKKKK